MCNDTAVSVRTYQEQASTRVTVTDIGLDEGGRLAGWPQQAHLVVTWRGERRHRAVEQGRLALVHFLVREAHEPRGSHCGMGDTRRQCYSWVDGGHYNTNIP